MTTAPLANRPEHAVADNEFDSDLTPADHVFPLLDVHTVDRVAEIPGALAALGALIDTLRGTANVEFGAGTIAVTGNRTPDELLQRLAARQRMYDEGRDIYQRYLDHVDAGDDEQAATIATVSKYRWHYYLGREGITAVGGHSVPEFTA
ncbi:hypothetical protein SEA_GALADRIEL_46 [Gordonia phage Galadriel]|uniref:Uncharacterized protein n=2 Tax=Vividuovirus TaxID=2560251 RepID=A0A7G8LDY0_9CAUD|nr:hypothetical protein KNU61_gp46 [Gordonia phage Galadriel]YP_010109503.1 hypothetical protein KNV17_gp49 [Gordonia phage Paries]QDH92065.1 hypothetical protein SEA_GALADRIEL_46 [Gordonia phage Galadriel]QNJ55452.1 hypothetical protein SEA_PARIES_49 [Gordonia phage Paries]